VCSQGHVGSNPTLTAKLMEDCPAGDAGPVLNAGGAERPGFRLRQSSAKFMRVVRGIRLAFQAERCRFDACSPLQVKDVNSKFYTLDF
jgi:hypothetical protein